MSDTTIKVDSGVRDRLRAVAHRRHVTLGALLDSVSRDLERAERMKEIAEQYETYAREDPAGFRAEISESHDWDQLAGDTLPPARNEYPDLQR
ncbi:hypothetical protein [Fodinicola feengrottensis]|nr:hypothetical protein [Fodinicola feengrottensis]